MVGGNVTEVRVVDAECLWVNCESTQHAGQFCAIQIERTEQGEKVEAGDMLWWQGRYAMHTPQENRKRPEDELRQGVDYDVQIPRASYSGVPRPNTVN